MKIQRLVFIFFILYSFKTLAQEDSKDLGDKEYIIVKDYKPVLAESNKISDNPEGDTTDSSPKEMDYTIRAKKFENIFETAAIKAVRIKDEPLVKLYHDYLKLGIGNYTTYNGELYVNTLRSKKAAAGLKLRHLSGAPSFEDFGDASFSRNSAAVYGNYFWDKTTFDGTFSYDRDVYHYYGFLPDTVIDKNDAKQRFNNFGINLGFGSNSIDDDKINFLARFDFRTITDLYEVTENDFRVYGAVGKQLETFYLNLDVSLDYFKKTSAKDQLLTVLSDRNRNIVELSPTISFNQDKAKLLVGGTIAIEKNLETTFRLFPKVKLEIPIAENILYAFAGVDGRVEKNNYATITDENPFVTPTLEAVNTIHKYEIQAGLNGNFSSRISFLAAVKYTDVNKLLLYYNDTIHPNQFNILFDDGNILNLHAELNYIATEKLDITFRFDQFSYKMDLQEKAWHRPDNEVALIGKYNFRDKILLKASLYARGSYFTRQQNQFGFISEKVKGYMDANLGVEYRYSKILSIYVNMNNLGFARYYRWYQYPSEKFNVLGGFTYSF